MRIIKIVYILITFIIDFIHSSGEEEYPLSTTMGEFSLISINTNDIYISYIIAKTRQIYKYGTDIIPYDKTIFFFNHDYMKVMQSYFWEEKNINIFVFKFKLESPTNSIYSFSILITDNNKQNELAFHTITPQFDSNVKNYCDSSITGTKNDFALFLVNLYDKVLFIKYQYTSVAFKENELTELQGKSIVSNIKCVPLNDDIFICACLGLEQAYIFSYDSKNDKFDFNTYKEPDVFKSSIITDTNKHFDIAKGKDKHGNDAIMICKAHYYASKYKIICYDILNNQSLFKDTIYYTVTDATLLFKIYLLSVEDTFYLFLAPTLQKYYLINLYKTIDYNGHSLYMTYYDATNQVMPYLHDTLYANNQFYLLLTKDFSAAQKSLYNMYFHSYIKISTNEYKLLGQYIDSNITEYTIDDAKTTITFTKELISHYQITFVINDWEWVDWGYGVLQLYIVPNYCKEYTSNYEGCQSCVDNYNGKIAYMCSDDNLCYLEDEIPDRYYKDEDNKVLLKCIDHCLKCSNGDECEKCESLYTAINGQCANSCPDGYIGVLLSDELECFLSKEFIENAILLEDFTSLIKEYLLKKKDKQSEYLFKLFEIIISNEFDIDNLNNIILYHILLSVSNIQIVNNTVAQNDEITSHFIKIVQDKIPFENLYELVYVFYTINKTLINNAYIDNSEIEDMKTLYHSLFNNSRTLIETIKADESKTEIEKQLELLQLMISISDINNHYISISFSHNLQNDTFNYKKYNQSKYYKYHNSIISNKENAKTISLIDDSSLLALLIDTTSSYHTSQHSLIVNAFDLDKGFNHRLPLFAISLMTENVTRTKNIHKIINSIKQEKVTTKIIFPLEAIKEQYSNVSFYGINQYMKYSYLHPNASNDIDSAFTSIKLYDKEYKEINIRDLSDDIIIVTKMHNNHYTDCVYYDKEIGNINSENCRSELFDEYMICYCNHLTDFSLSSFNPYNIIRDINTLFHNVRIINSFEIFSLMTWSNAIVLYIFLSLIVLYIVGMVFVVSFDMKNGKNCFIVMIADKEYCCSKEAIEKDIEEIKTEVVEVIDERERIVKKNFFIENVEKSRKERNKAILNSLGIKIKGINEDIDTSVEEEKKKKKSHNIFQKIIARRKTLTEKPNCEIELQDYTNKRVSLDIKPKLLDIETDNSNNSIHRRDGIVMNSNIDITNPPFCSSSSIILKSIFTKEYRIYTIISNDADLPLCKTNILTLFFVRLVAGLSISSLFSECNSISNKTLYFNRDIAVAFITILIIEIPFTIFEILLSKTKVLSGMEKEEIQSKTMCTIITYILIYIMFIVICVLGIINTIWISLIEEENYASCDYLLDFLLNVLMDNLIYETGIIILKSFMYTFLIKSDKHNWLRICCVSVLSIIPWILSIVG